MFAIRALFEEIDANNKLRDARITAQMNDWHSHREEAAACLRVRGAWLRDANACADAGETGADFESLLRQAEDLHQEAQKAWGQSWAIAVQLHQDGVRDPTNGCNCRACHAWRADHARAFAQEDWEHRPSAPPASPEEAEAEAELEVERYRQWAERRAAELN